MSPVLTVEQVITGQDNPPRAWNSTKGGAMLAHKVIFREHPGREVEWSRKQSSDAPVPGQQVEGTIDWQHQYGARFKMDAAPGSGGGGGGGFKPRDPRETAAIQWQHSQDMSIQTVRLACDLGLLKPQSTGELFAAIDAGTQRFQRDIEKAAPAPEPVPQQPMVRKDIERTGQSDVPSDGAEFSHPAPSPAPNEDPIPW